LKALRRRCGSARMKAQCGILIRQLLVLSHQKGGSYNLVARNETNLGCELLQGATRSRPSICCAADR